MDIIVLAGGLSTERDVSFKTGSMVASALKENGHRVILLDVFMGYSDKEENLDGIFDRADEISVKVDDIPEVAPDLAAVKASRKDQSPCFFGPNVIRMCQMADIVFMALHGENGENGKLQAAFDLLGVKYTGSDYLSSAIAMNKGMAKQLFASAGIPAPRGIAMKKENREDDVTKLPLTIPISLYTPSPTGVAVDVHRRRPHRQSLIAFTTSLRCIVGILGTGFIGYGSKYLVYSLRRERCRHTNRLGKHCGQPGTRHSMQRFIPPVIGLDAQTFHWFGAVHHQGHLLFERQFLQQKSGTLFCRQRCILVSSLPASRQ